MNVFWCCSFFVIFDMTVMKLWKAGNLKYYKNKKNRSSNGNINYR